MREFADEEGQSNRTHKQALICFKSPEAASLAKQADIKFGNCQVKVNPYVLPSEREKLKRKQEDVASFQSFQAENISHFKNLNM